MVGGGHAVLLGKLGSKLSIPCIVLPNAFALNLYSSCILRLYVCAMLCSRYGDCEYSVRSKGIMQAVLLDNGLAATSTLAFVGSLSNACCAFFAIVNTRIAGSIGARTTSILGIFLLGLGEILSSFSYRSLGGLFTTSGAISGIGARYAVKHYSMSFTESSACASW